MFLSRAIYVLGPLHIREALMLFSMVDKGQRVFKEISSGAEADPWWRPIKVASCRVVIENIETTGSYIAAHSRQV